MYIMNINQLFCVKILILYSIKRTFSDYITSTVKKNEYLLYTSNKLKYNWSNMFLTLQLLILKVLYW